MEEYKGINGKRMLAKRHKHRQHQKGADLPALSIAKTIPAAAISHLPPKSFPVQSPLAIIPNGQQRQEDGGLPQFHFLLVLLSFSVIVLAIIGAFLCCFHTLINQRRNRRKRQKAAEESAEEAEESQRLIQINKFIARQNPLGIENPAADINCNDDGGFLTTTMGGGGVVPRIKVTSTETEDKGGGENGDGDSKMVPAMMPKGMEEAAEQQQMRRGRTLGEKALGMDFIGRNGQRAEKTKSLEIIIRNPF